MSQLRISREVDAASTRIVRALKAAWTSFDKGVCAAERYRHIRVQLSRQDEQDLFDEVLEGRHGERLQQHAQTRGDLRKVLDTGNLYGVPVEYDALETRASISV